MNQKSRSAILRIGAKEEGTLRRHLVTWTGRVRDTVYFSILDEVVWAREAYLRRLIAAEERGSVIGSIPVAFLPPGMPPPGFSL